jgi:transcriptional regulator with GAF, ATPase, and Fis domain
MRPPPSAIELEDVIRRFEGNMMRVARELDRKPALVYRWAKRYKINVDSFRKKEI